MSEMGWKLIDTAPKDRPIIVGQFDITTLNGEAEGAITGAYWSSAGWKATGTEELLYFFTPTHWMDTTELPLKSCIGLVFTNSGGRRYQLSPTQAEPDERD